MCECKFPEGLSIKPDGVHELDPCVYKRAQVFTNCTVEVAYCENCGKLSLSWYRTPETEEVPEEYWEDVCHPYHD